MLSVGLSLCGLLALVSFSKAQECGVALSGSRIVGGQEVGSYKYPWFAMLMVKDGNYPACGGTLISDMHVLTAAHCFGGGGSNEDMYNVVLGAYDRCEQEETQQTFTVTKVHVHKKYTDKFYDIALMVLDRSADSFTPACLPPPGANDGEEDALVMGFGVTSEGGREEPCKMLEAEIMKYSQEHCQQTGLPSQDTNEESVFCAGARNKDTCQGDSGGPLLTYNSDGNYVVTGIVSYGYGCGRPEYPGVYTNVGSYIDWIEEKKQESRMTAKLPLKFVNQPSVHVKQPLIATPVFPPKIAHT